jgi:predicted amidohydrolase YtcJ
MNADLVLRNGKFYTLDPARPRAEAVAIMGGRVAAVGTDADAEAWTRPGTQVIDLGGRLALPGLIDSHVHFLVYALRRHQVSLDGVSDWDEVLRRIRAGVERVQPGEWVLGWGWNQFKWGDGRLPGRVDLDDLAPDHPVALTRTDGHAWWVNSLALELAQVTAQTPDPPNSRIERDAHGEPTGILLEGNAIDLIRRHIPEPDRATVDRVMRETMAAANRLGLTGIHDQRFDGESSAWFHGFQRLRHGGELTLRVHANIAKDRLADAVRLGVESGFGDDRLWIGHLKLFADGTMGSRTALMFEPFEGEPDNRGVAVTPADEIWQIATQASVAGIPLSIHAIGDRAVSDVLDVFTELQHHASAQSGPTSQAIPHRIEHVQLIRPADLPRLAQLGVVASVQPVHILDDWHVADRVWGPRARYAYAFRSLLDHGTQLAFGSDAPVASLNPLLGIQAAVTRQGRDGEPADGWYPQERLTVAEAIHGYTVGPARLAGKDDRQGSISPGKWADLVVLARNLFEIPPDEIAATEVALTVFDGQVVYQAM